MHIQIVGTFKDIQSDLPTLLANLPNSLVEKIRIQVLDKAPSPDNSWQSTLPGQLSHIPLNVTQLLPWLKSNTKADAMTALSCALLRWARDNKPQPPSPQLISLQDISAGDVIRGTWAEKETNVSHSIEGEVDSVYLEDSELWLVNNSRLEIKETQDFTATTLYLIKKAPEGKLLQPQDLRTLPIGSLLTVTFSHPSVGRDKPCTREKVALTRRYEDASGFSYDLDVNTYPESSILKVVLLSQPNSKGNN